MIVRWISALLVAGMVLAGGPRPGFAHTAARAEPRGAAGASAETLGASIAQLTQTLLGSPAVSAGTGLPLTSREADDLVAVATLRRQLLSALLEVDPGSVLRLAIPSTLRARLAPELLPYVEEHVQVEGELAALYEDWANGSRLVYELQSGTGPLASLRRRGAGGRHGRSDPGAGRPRLAGARRAGGRRGRAGPCRGLGGREGYRRAEEPRDAGDVH
jgi:hypothetical protein